MGGKTRTDAEGEVTKGWDHDPPAKEKLVPFGVLMLATGALMLLFGLAETSDAYSGPQKVDHSGHVHLLRLSRVQPPRISPR